jgi:hypothetical protein
MKKTALTIFTAILVVSSLVLGGKVIAQSVLPLSVIPPKQEVLINPGENYSTIIKFQNLSTAPVSGSLSAFDFIVTDNIGTPVFLDNPTVVGTTTVPAKYSAAKWVKLYTDKMTIASDGNVSVPVTISVPKNAAPGGRYAAIIFEPAGSLSLGNPASAGETPISIRIASLLYIRVAGPISESASVSKFQVPGFLEYGPVNVSTEVTNMGDYHFMPVGSVTLKNMIGMVVASSAIEAKNVFPGTTRVFNNQLGGKLMFGKFTVNFNATYGSTGKVLSASSSLWILPWKIMIAIALAVIIMVALILLGYKRFIKKEAELVEEIKEEKTEIEALKEKFEDKISSGPAPKESAPEKPKQTK